MARNDDDEDLAPQETGYVRVVGHISAEQPPLWRPRLVLSRQAESAGPGTEIIMTPTTVEDFAGRLDRQLEAAVQPLAQSPVRMRPAEVLVMFELVRELGFVYAGTQLADLAGRVGELLHDRMMSESRASEIDAARRVVMPLAASRVTPESAIGGLWRVDDATGRPVGLISGRGVFSPSFAPTQAGVMYEIGDLVRIARSLPRDADNCATVHEALAALESHIRALATS